MSLEQKWNIKSAREARKIKALRIPYGTDVEQKREN